MAQPSLGTSRVWVARSFAGGQLLGRKQKRTGQATGFSRPVRLAVVHFFGFRGACARSDAIGPRSRFGVLGLRKSLPACDASRFEVVIRFVPFLVVLRAGWELTVLYYAFYSPLQIPRFG
jgi:hypothetical protein